MGFPAKKENKGFHLCSAERIEQQQQQQQQQQQKHIQIQIHN